MKMIIWKLSSQVKSSILFSQTASHLHIKVHIQNNVFRDGKAEKHSLSSCLINMVIKRYIYMPADV